MCLCKPWKGKRREDCDEARGDPGYWDGRGRTATQYGSYVGLAACVHCQAANPTLRTLTWARKHVRAHSMTALVHGQRESVNEQSNYKDYKMDCTTNLFYESIIDYNVTLYALRCYKVRRPWRS